jgi:hypothetical protein
MKRRAKLISTRRVKDWDAGLYESLAPQSQCETNAVIMSLPQVLSDLV